MSILDFLASDGYITVNKTLIKLLGLEEAVIIGELSSEYLYWKNENKLEDGMFYCTVENMEENTGLSIHKQRKAINNLESMGVISTVKKGLPAKRYIKINTSKLIELLDCEELNDKTVKNKLSSELKINALDSENFTTNKNNIKTIKNKNNKKEDMQKQEIKKLIKTKDSSQLFVDMYYQFCPSFGKITKITESRKRDINKLFKNYDKHTIEIVLKKCEASDFLVDNVKGWAKFDWIIKDSNFIKILEGNYDNHKATNKKKSSIESRYGNHLAKGKYDTSNVISGE